MNLPNKLQTKLSKNAKLYYDGYKNDNQEKIDKACNNLYIDTCGWDCIGNGSGRNVFDMNILGYENYVLKLAIPHSKYDGIKQNKKEYMLWNKLDSEKKNYLAPVIDADSSGYWLVMEKGVSDFKIDYEWIENAKYYLRDYVWVEDIYDENIVSINGELKICDYGTNVN